MYDYRNDVIKLMKETSDTDASLHQSAVALNMLLKAYFSQSDILFGKSDIKSIKEHEILENIKPSVKSESDSIKFVKKADLHQIVDSNKIPNGYNQIERKLSGAIAKDKNGSAVAYFNESICRDHDLNNGDYVYLNIVQPYNPDAAIGERGKAFIENIIPHAKPSQIETFGPAIVEEKDIAGVKKRIVSRDINGNSLFNKTGILSYEVNSLHTQAGDSVILAWYKGSLNTMTIRWNYSMDNDNSSVNRPKAHSYYTEKEKETNDSYNARLKFDLGNQKVALVVADKALLKNTGKVVKAHHGSINFVDSSISSTDLVKRLQGFPIIIMIQSYMHHSDTNEIIKQLSNNHQIAMATTAGQFEIEKALYRAVNKLNVYDNNIDYEKAK